MDRDGFISNGELFLVLKMMVGNNLKVRLHLLPPPFRAWARQMNLNLLAGFTTSGNCRQDNHGGGQGRRWEAKL
jgi:hypothetical protein